MKRTSPEHRDHPDQPGRRDQTVSNSALGELKDARDVLEAEASSILAAKDRLGEEFIRALDLMAQAITRGGKVVVTGVGKSGKVASKVAATLSSTGTFAVFMHPTEAAHGDLGIVSEKDTVLVYSHSGNSEEVLRLLPSFNRLGVKLVAVVGQLQSQLGRQADVVLNAEIAKEACPLNLAPTSSTTVAIALGDALALGLSRRWNFQEDNFAVFHPAGALGRRLTLVVRDLMKTGSDLAWASAEAGMDEIVAKSTEKKLGAVLIYAEHSEGGAVNQNPENYFIGLITDGDIRRSLKHKARFFDLKAKDVMTAHPVSIRADEKASDALRKMENRPSQISILPVIDETTLRCLGLIRLHDLIGQL